MMTYFSKIQCTGLLVVLAGLLSLTVTECIGQGNSIVGEPFITVAKPVEQKNNPSIYDWVPSNKMIKFAWTDQAFTVNFPIDVEFGKYPNGKPYSKAYKVLFYLEGGNALIREKDSNKPYGVHVGMSNRGYYRLDGRDFQRADATNRQSTQQHWLRKASISVSVKGDPDDMERDGSVDANSTFVQRISSSTGPGKLVAWASFNGLYDSSHVAAYRWKSSTGIKADLVYEVWEEDLKGNRAKKVGEGKVPFLIQHNGWKIVDVKDKRVGNWGNVFSRANGDPSDVNLQDLGVQKDVKRGGWWNDFRRTVKSGSERTSFDQPSQLVISERTFYDHYIYQPLLWTVYTPVKSGVVRSDTGILNPIVTAFHFEGDTRGTARVAKNHVLSDGHGRWSTNLNKRAGDKEQHYRTYFSMTPTRGEGGGMRPKNKKISDYELLKKTISPYWTANDIADGPFLLYRIEVPFAASKKLGDKKPRKIYDIYARRLSDLTSNHAGPVPSEKPRKITPIAEKNDGFWNWFEQWTDLVEESNDIHRTHKLAIEKLAHAHKKDMKEWLQWMAEDMSQFKRPKKEKAIGGENKGLQFDIVQSAMASFDRTPEWLRAKRDSLKLKMDIHRSKQAYYIKEVLATKQKVIDSLKKQHLKNPKRWRFFPQNIEFHESRYNLLRVELYYTAGERWLGELGEALDDMGIDVLGADALGMPGLHMQARYYDLLSQREIRKDWLQSISPKGHVRGRDFEGGVASALARAHTAQVKALEAVRKIREINPNDEFAIVLRRKIEAGWLKQLAVKMERAKGVALEDMASFLKSRGFKLSEPEDWPEYFGEWACQVWGTGPIKAFAAFYLSSSIADGTGVVHDSVAKNQYAILFLQRLVGANATLPTESGSRRPVFLEDIPKLRRLELLEVWKSTGRKELTPRQLDAAFTAIHETIKERPDLRMLTSGKPAQYMKEFEKDYYQTLGLEPSWPEMIGDEFFSPRGLFWNFGPGAIAQVNGKWTTIQRMSVGEIQILEKANKIKTGRDVFYGMKPFVKMGERIRSVPGAAGVLKTIGGTYERHNKFMEGLGLKHRFAREIGHNVGHAIATGLIEHALQEMGYHNLARLIWWLDEYSQSNVASNFFTSPGKRKLIADRMDKFVDSGSSQMDDANKFLASSKRMRQSAEALKAGQSIPSTGNSKSISGTITSQAEDVERLADTITSGAALPTDHIDGKASAIRYSASQSAEAMQSRRYDEAIRASSASEELVEESVEELADTIDLAKKTKDTLRSANVPEPPKIDTIKTEVVVRKTESGTVISNGRAAANSSGSGTIKSGGESPKRSDGGDGDVAKKVDADAVEAEVPETVDPNVSVTVNLDPNAPRRRAKKRVVVNAAEDTLPSNLMNRDLYDKGELGQMLEAADQLLLDQKIDEATHLYRKIRKAVLDDDAGLEIGKSANRKLAEIGKSNYYRKLRQKNWQKYGKAEGLNDDLLDSEISAVKRNVARATNTNKRMTKEAKAGVWIVDDGNGNKYVIKEIKDGTSDAEIAGELTGPAFYDEIGLDSPAITIVDFDSVNLDAFENNKPMKGFMMRYVEGSTLGKLEADSIFAYQEDLELIRLANAFLLNIDTHGGNVMTMKNGKFSPIDFGFAEVTQSRRFRLLEMQGGALKEEFDSIDEAIEAALRFAYGDKNVFGSERFEKLINMPAWAHYGWFRRVDELASYQRLKKHVETITSPFKDTSTNNRYLQRLKKIHGDLKGQAIFDEKKSRVEPFKRVIEKMYGTPIGDSHHLKSVIQSSAVMPNFDGASVLFRFTRRSANKRAA